MSYRVELPVFSGPLDLLLHLIRQQEVDIHEVRISRILNQYLEHLAVLKSLDLTDIGDFVVMASTLMEIKSRELLPTEEVAIGDAFDPRDDLIRRLLEYKRYRDISRRFDRLAKRRSRMLAPSLPLPKDLATEADEQPMLDLGNVEIWALTAAFAKLLEETGTDRTMHVGVARRNVRYYTERVLGLVMECDEAQFETLFDPTEGRYGLIGVFAAVLELMKQGYVRTHQPDCFGPITVAFVGRDGMTVEEVLSGIEGEDLLGDDEDDEDVDAALAVGDLDDAASEGEAAGPRPPEGWGSAN